MKILAKSNVKFHKHDCDKCKYLGSVVVSKNKYISRFDMYFCEYDKDLSYVIARYDSEGDKYIALQTKCISKNRDDYILSYALRRKIDIDIKKRINETKFAEAEMMEEA